MHQHRLERVLVVNEAFELRGLTAADSRFSRAELLEIRAVTLPQPGRETAAARRVFEFSIRLVQRASTAPADHPGAPVKAARI
jgi:hypothetical protein